MTKWIYFYSEPGAADAPSLDLAALDLKVTEKTAVDLAQVDQSPFEKVGMRVRDPLAWTAISHQWADTQPSPVLEPQCGAPTSGWQANEIVAWDYERDWADGTPTPGVKFVSTVTKRPDISIDEFETRYRGHAKVAREHHVGCWKYVQNIVTGPAALSGSALSGAAAAMPAIHGVSELWFRTVDDLVERLYAHGAASIDAVRADTTGFIDFTNTASVLMQEHWIRS